MKKKARQARSSSKKTAVKKKYKSYYIPVAERKSKVPKKPAVKPVVKKKYKSYYKPKKKVEADTVKTKEVVSVVRELPKGEVTVPVITPTTSKRPVKYLNNKDLLAQVILSKKNGKMTNELAKMLMLLTQRYGKKGNFANYTYNEDMQGYAIVMICKTWQGFDPAKSSNPFAWFTQCIKNSFIQYLNNEKRQRDIKDGVLVDNGFSPSYSYQHEYAQEYHAHGGGDPGEHVNVELQEKSAHNNDTFDVPEDNEEVPTSDTM